MEHICPVTPGLLRTCGSFPQVLLHIPARALAEFADEQPAGADLTRSATKNECGGSVPGREVRADAGVGEFALRGRHEVGTRRYLDLNRLAEASEAG